MTYHGALIFLDHNGQKRKEYKLKKGYDTHYTYTDEEGNTAFVVERQYTDETKQEKKFISHSKWENKIDGSTKWHIQTHGIYRKNNL